MGRRRKDGRKTVDVPLPPAAQAPVLLQATPADPSNGPPAPIADPQPMMPDSPEALLNNVLCREIQQPSPALHEPSDPNLLLLDELAKGLTAGTDLNHVREDVLRVASNQPEKVNVIKSMLLAIDLNRAARFAKVRDKAEKELARSAMRGDLSSTEYLAFLRFSSTELKEIGQRLNPQEVMQSNSSTDSVAMMDRMDHAKRVQEAEQEAQFDGTTPQGMEIVRKQVFKIKKRLQKAGKLKSQKEAGPKKKKPSNVS